MNRFVLGALFSTALLSGQTKSPDKPTWWNKYQALWNKGAETKAGTGSSITGPNLNVSDECGPQSETFITLNPVSPSNLVAGSNEIFRLPMRGYYSFDGGRNWGGVDLPLPPPIGSN